MNHNITIYNPNVPHGALSKSHSEFEKCPISSVCPGLSRRKPPGEGRGSSQSQEAEPQPPQHQLVQKPLWLLGLVQILHGQRQPRSSEYIQYTIKGLTYLYLYCALLLGSLHYINSDTPVFEIKPAYNCYPQHTLRTNMNMSWNLCLHSGSGARPHLPVLPPEQEPGWGPPLLQGLPAPPRGHLQVMFWLWRPQLCGSLHQQAQAQTRASEARTD